MFKKVRQIVGALIAHQPPIGAIVRFPKYGNWNIADGVDYSMPIPMPARLNEAGYEVEREHRLREAAKQYQSQFGDPFVTDTPWQMLPTIDPLNEWDWSTRRDVLERTNLLWKRNPIAKAAVGYTRQFAVGKGATIVYQNDVVEEICTEFLENSENAWKQLEKELIQDLQVDGELFIRFHTGSDGEAIITTIPPSEVHEIVTDPEFFRRVESYNGWHGGNRFEIPDNEVLHVAINKKSYWQRGIPDLYAIIPWLHAYKSWLENRARHNAYRGLMYDVTLTNATASQVAARLMAIKEPPAGPFISVHNQNEEWRVDEAKIGANEAADDGRQIKLMAAVGLQMPEYFLADGENANLASATAQQLPALRTFEDWQDIMEEQVVGGILRKVVEINIAAGRVSEYVSEMAKDGTPTGEQIKAVKAFTVSYPSLEAADPKTIAEALAIAVDHEWISNETAAGELPFGVDYQVEQRKIEAELQAQNEQIEKGLRPRPISPFGGGMSPFGGNEQEQENNEEE